jgi:hypothetical protein
MKDEALGCHVGVNFEERVLGWIEGGESLILAYCVESSGREAGKVTSFSKSLSRKSALTPC